MTTDKNKAALDAFEDFISSVEHCGWDEEINKVRQALLNGVEHVAYWDFENEMEDVTNRDNGKIVSAFLMKRFPHGVIIKDTKGE